MHTNDIHSSLENHMRLGSLLRQKRVEIQRAGHPVYTVDLGDVLDRVRPETEVTSGLLNAYLMRSLGYDAWVFGNNEGLTIPVEQWSELVRLSGALFLSTNMRDVSGEKFPFGVDWIVEDHERVKIGMFGVTENFENPYRVLGVRVLDPIQTAIEATRTLRQMGCDVVIALTHLGLWKDRKLAAAVPGLSLVLGGHSHHFMDTLEWVEGTAIFQAGKHALAFGHTEVLFDEETGSVRSVVCNRIDVPEDGVSDEAMLRTYQQQEGPMQAMLARPVLTLSRPLPVRLDGPSPFADVLVEALFDAFPADVGIMMSGALTASLMPGEIQVQHLLGACTTPTRPVLLTLFGRDILSILGKSIQPEYYFRQGIGYGFRGSVVGVLALKNATMQITSSPDGHSHVYNVRIGGRPIDENREYRVVTCEYLWLSSTFEEFHKGQDIEFGRPLVREILMDYLADGRLTRND